MAAIKAIMNKKVVTVKQDATVQEVSRMLIKNKLSGIPVVDANMKLVGFISERDIIAAISNGISLSTKTKAVMIRNVISIKESASVEQVSQRFTTHPFRYIPVTKNKKVIGVVSRKEVIENLLGQYY